MRSPLCNRRTRFTSLALRLTVVAVLLIGLARTGRAYFVCHEMGTVSQVACCAHCPSSTGEEAPAIDRAPCCARQLVDAMPSATTTSAATVPDAPLIATVQPASPRELFAQTQVDVCERMSSRAQPPPGDTRTSRLMVFRL